MRRRFMMALMVVAGAGAQGVSPAAAQIALDPFEVVSGFVQVVEGDVLSVNGAEVRLYGIDAPELRQTCRNARGAEFDCGAAARAVLERLIGDQQVECTIYSRPDRRRGVGRCRMGTTDLGQAMVQRGWAFALSGQSHRYDLDQSRAQAVHAGLWAGRAQPPWEWRLAHRDGGAGATAARR